MTDPSRTDPRRTGAGRRRNWLVPLVAIVLTAIAGGVLLVTIHGRQTAGAVVPVAIVNDDVPVTTGSGDNQKKVAAGRQLAAGLTRPDPGDATPLSWQIVDAKDAAEGLRKGGYYAVLTIPKDFSAQLTSTAGDKPTQAQLKLVGNDASSVAVTALASLAVDQAASSLGAQATNGFVDNTLSSFTTINKNLTSTASSAHKLADSSHQLADSSDDLASGSESLKKGAAQLDSGAAQAASGAAQVSSGARQLDTAAGNLAGGANQLASATGSLESGANRLATGNAGLAAAAGAIAAGEKRVAGQAAIQATRLGQLTTVTGNTRDRAASMRQRADDLVAECERRNNPREFCASLRILADQARIQQGSTRVVDDGVKLGRTRASGISDASRGLASKGVSLQTNAAKLAGAARQLSSGAAQLDTAAGSLASGAAQLDSAAGSLASGAATSASGAASVASGADQNSAGAAQLDNGADQLASGAKQLASGADQLASGLDTFAKSVPSYSDDQRKALDTVVTTPVTVDSSADHQSTLARGLIPAALGLALWLGGLMMFLTRSAVPTGSAWAQASVGRRLLVGLAPAVLVGLVQAALLLLLISVGGVKIASPVGLAAFCALGVVCFAAINQALVALFGGIGRLVAVALTVVEAAALGGIIPVETAPGFIQLLNGALPVPRFVDGAGQLVLGGTSGGLLSACVTLVVWLALALLATMFVIARRRPALAPARLTPSPSPAGPLSSGPAGPAPGAPAAAAGQA